MNKPNDSQIRESAVGTGVTQVAPVIEAIIEASKITNHGSVLFLEEPETNLHPSAQQNLQIFYTIYLSLLTFILKLIQNTLLIV